MSSPADITGLLRRHGQGDAEAREQLLQLLYDDLHGVAGALMRKQGPEHTLQPTALVNEAYLRLLGEPGGEGWRSREHFLAVAARAMRFALVDHARKRGAVKRGGGAERQALDHLVVQVEERCVDLVDLDEALSRLAQRSERAAQVVEARFFGGLTAEETASALGASLRTVERDWRMARAWLADELTQE